MYFQIGNTLFEI